MTLSIAFAESAQRYRTKLAFVDRSTQREVTYGRALIAAHILARRFRREEDVYLGVMLPTSAGCGLAVIGCLFAGKVPVMINYSTGAETNARYAQSKCGFKTIITSRKLLEKVGCDVVPGMVFLEDVMENLNAGEKLLAAVKARMPVSWLGRRSLHRANETDTAVILFTSGSEKSPKAVELSHRNIFSNQQACVDAFSCTPEDRMLAVLPLFHVFGLTTTFWLPLCQGMTLITYANPLEFKNVARIIREEKPTIIIATPYFLAGYLKQAQPGDYDSLRLVIVGADKMPDWLHRSYLEEHQVEVYEGYGATETAPVISANRPGAVRPGSIGQPLPGVKVRIVDIDSGEQLPPGREGKILVKGDLVMKGYLGDVEETALRIENGWYETGDMGVIDEAGFLWHRGRLKRFIKIGGEMVSLVQVESVLEPLLPDGVECCAVELPDKRRGAAVGVALTAALDQQALLAELGKVLPALALPRQFFVLDELPKMGSGKIDFRSTAERVRELLDA